MTRDDASSAAAQALTELILEIFRLNGRLLDAGDALVADIGLTSARWQTLGAVALSPQPMSVAQIARAMGLARQSVQRVANELERDGLIRFAPNPQHERAKLAVLTEKGAAAYREAMARQALWAARLAAGSAAAEIDAARALLATLRARLENEKENGNGA
jgi:DNA-binding MarR family transcriptional regulator